MRVLQINSAHGFGGGEKHLVDLVASLREREHRIFVALRRSAVWRGRLDFLPRSDLIFLPLKNALDVASARRLARFIEQEKIEIVHAHLARDYSVAALAVLLCRNWRARLVLTRHVLFRLNRLHKLLLPRDTTFIAVSKAVRDNLAMQRIVAPDRLKLVYNGVDTNAFVRARQRFDRAAYLAKLDLPAERRFVGILGEITAHKGQTDFVRAAAIVAENHADVDFLIVGQDGSKQKRRQTELVETINQLSLTNRVHLLGWRHDVAEVLCALDVFVSASLVEPFGLAIVEAMAANLPVVATASAGASEILIDNETGKLVPVNDHNAIAAAVVELLENPQTRARLTAQAQTAARARFDLTRMAIETEKVYSGET